MEIPVPIFFPILIWQFFPRLSWEHFFHSHSQSQKLGIELFIPIPNPKSWEWNFSFPFPIPKVGNRFGYFPFPIPNVQKSLPLMPVKKSVCLQTIQIFATGTLPICPNPVLGPMAECSKHHFYELQLKIPRLVMTWYESNPVVSVLVLNKKSSLPVLDLVSPSGLTYVFWVFRLRKQFVIFYMFCVTNRKPTMNTLILGS